ncbi:MAG: thioredoxin family protein [Candidatus Methanoperedens sp.]
MRTKKLLSILILALILAFAYFSYQTALNNFTLSDKNNSYLGGIKFHRAAEGLEESFQIAQQENKPVMMYFWAIWCQYCAKFQTDTLGNPQVKKILEEDYLLVAMDLDIDREVAQKYGVSYPPYLVFMDPKGNVLERVPGAVDADYLLPIVTRVRDQVRSKT